jgi:hypothetical protein
MQRSAMVHTVPLTVSLPEPLFFMLLWESKREQQGQTSFGNSPAAGLLHRLETSYPVPITASVSLEL